jgi:acyl-CoA reductase-like NAD-dependent aldehyde dehydrogenase
VINTKSLENLEGITGRAVKEGAEHLTCGERIEGRGAYYRPAILSSVTPSMKVALEKVFGPLVPVIVADNEKEAKIAKDSKFGLGASIWTQNLEKAEEFSSMVQSGIVTVNNVVISDPRVPFGGIKSSGFGRELSRYCMLGFVNIKSVKFYDQLVHGPYVE